MIVYLRWVFFIRCSLADSSDAELLLKEIKEEIRKVFLHVFVFNVLRR
jgi:hypothetical protein